MIIDVAKALDALGIEYEEKGHEASALCPMHWERTGKDDRSPSWWINLDSGMHICFSCHYKGNLLQLVCDANQFYISSYGDTYSYDYNAAQNWLAGIAQIPLEKLKEIVANLPNYLEPAPKPIDMSEARLAIFMEPPQDALDSRKITADAAREYGVLWDEKKANWVLPLREPHFNKLIGWQEKGTIQRTFMNRPTGLPKSKTLFGVNTQNESLAIVVESPLDCVRIASAGFPGALAICGSNPSEDQVKLLRYSERIIAAFDNPKVDKAGRKACEEMRQFARKYGLNLAFFNYGDTGKKDPGDLTDEEIAWGIQNAKSSLLGEKAYV
jgi:DNA primase